MEGNGHYRVIGILPDTKNVDEEFTFEDIEDTVKQHIVVPVDFEEVLWFSSYKVHSRKAASFENKRCYLAGDAAHIHTPAGGQGMNTGIQDAYNLAWKIAYTIKKRLKLMFYKLIIPKEVRMQNICCRLQTGYLILWQVQTLLWNFIRLHIMTRFLGLLARSASLKRRIFPFLSQIGIKYSANCLILNSVHWQGECRCKNALFYIF
jgi:hypothetical protein